MYRFLLELLFLILIAIVARAVVTSFMRGVANASRRAYSDTSNSTAQQPGPDGNATRPTGELHKDPVCGTYVAESTPFQRRTGVQTFYYCSEACREKHALVAR